MLETFVVRVQYEEESEEDIYLVRGTREQLRQAYDSAREFDDHEESYTVVGREHLVNAGLEVLESTSVLISPFDGLLIGE